MKCDHKRVKKNWPFGRKSKPTVICKDCGEIVKRKSNDGKKRRGKNTGNRGKFKSV